MSKEGKYVIRIIKAILREDLNNAKSLLSCDDIDDIVLLATERICYSDIDELLTKKIGVPMEWFEQYYDENYDDFDEEA